MQDFHTALGDFAAGRARVLLGTQMIAKGLDVPGVQLVGVIDADTSIHLPDFRASERTFQLVSQVTGRCGRGKMPGLAIVQTMASDLYEHIQQQPLVDSHEHLHKDDDWVNDGPTDVICDLFSNHIPAFKTRRH